MTSMNESFKRFSTRLETARSGELRPWIDEALATLKLGGPIILTQLALMAVMTTDVILLGWLGPEPLAAGALGVNIYFLIWIVLSGPTFAVSPIIAQARGANPDDITTVQHAVRMGLWTAALVLPLAVIILWFAEPLYLFLGQPATLAAEAATYVLALAPGMAFAVGFSVLRNFTTALDRPRPSLYVILGSIVVNGVLASTLIFGLFGFPKLGVLGAGIASALSNVFAFVAMSVVVMKTPEFARFKVFEKLFVFDQPMFNELVRLGVPIGLTMLFEGALFSAAAFLMGGFGIDELAAHQIALNICSVTFMVPLGIAMAGTVRVGHAAGAGNREAARRAGFTVMAIGGAFMALCGVVMWVMPHTLVGLYLSGAENARAAELGATYLAIAAFFQLFDALQVSGSFALRGLKDTRAPMILAASSYWLVGFTSSLVLGFGLGWGGEGIWIGLVLGLAAAAVAMVVRFAWLSRTTGRPPSDVESTEQEDIPLPLAREAA